MKKLSPYNLAELWSQIGLKSWRLEKAAKRNDTVEAYRLIDDLDTLRRKLQHHHAAVTIEAGTKVVPVKAKGKK